MTLKTFIDGTRNRSARQQCMPIASADSGGMVQHYFKIQQSTNWMMTNNK
jgi:hypothetical protein